MKRIQKVIGIILILTLALSALSGCSSQNSKSNAGTNAVQGGQKYGEGGKNGFPGKSMNGGPAQSGTEGAKKSENSQPASGTSQSNQILGKVTSIVGNEVTLALGTQSDSSDSSSLTLTGETKTLLIPVGLTLSEGNDRMTQNPGGGITSGSAGNGAMPTGGMPAGGGEGLPGNTGTTGINRTGGTSTKKANGTTGTTATAVTTQRSSDFSSITKGMILRITQREINGTETVVRVSVVSK